MKLLSSLIFAVLMALLPLAHANDPEFGGQCALGMSEGNKIATDCSVLWIGPNDKIYCFYNEDAKRRFLQAPAENISRAQAAWQDPDNLKRLLRKE
ncbi:MAG: hypothetical protein ABI648_08865 [Betaproteobacteria bacterium]